MPSKLASRVQNLEASLGQLQVDEGAVITGGDSVFASLDVLSDTFPSQRSFIEDQAPMKAAFCTRRGAKTYSVALDYINDARTHPRNSYTFAGLTRETAREQFWDDVLKEINLKYNIGIRFNESRLVAWLPNGARIRLVGGDAKEDEQRKLLGGKRRKVCLDEAQDWKTDLEPMLLGTIKPSVVDRGGQLIMTGTPGNMVNGYFHRVTRGCVAGTLSPPDVREPGWSLHTWTTHENTAIVDGIPMNVRWAKEIADLIAANPRVVEVPWFRQHYKGEWVVDAESRVYKYTQARNAYVGALPIYKGGQWHFGIAVDLGYHPDPVGIVLLAYHDWDRKLYIVHSWKQWRMDFTDVSERIHWFEDLVRSEHRQTLDFYVVDGANKQGVAEMVKRHGIPLQAAQKQAKNDYIDLMNADFILGNIQINTEKCCDGIREGRHTLALVDEYESLIWDPKTLPGAKEWTHNTQRKEHPACQNHLTDAALYGWRFCYPYLSNAPAKPVEKGTDEWYKQEEERMRAQAEDEMRQRIESEMEARGEEPGLPDSSNWEPWAK